MNIRKVNISAKFLKVRYGNKKEYINATSKNAKLFIHRLNIQKYPFGNINQFMLEFNANFDPKGISISGLLLKQKVIFFQRN